MNTRPPPSLTLVPAADQGRESVLVVEDDDLVRATVAMQLEGNGWDVLTAANIGDAQSALRKNPAISVVVSDIHLASESGFDLADALTEQRPEALATEIIFITGHATSDTAIEALRHRAFDLIPKPVRRADLASRVAAAKASAARRRHRQAMLNQLEDRIDRGEALRRSLVTALRDAENKNRALEESAGQARHDLLAVISHELKTPLIPIVGLADIMLATSDLSDEDVREYATMIRDGGERLGTIIDRTLAYLDAERQHALAEICAFGLAGMIDDAQRDLGAAAEGIRIEVDCPPGLRAWGPQKLLAEALRELLDNAVKATAPGGCVRVTAQPVDKGYIALDVCDDGPGLPDVVRGNLGIPFLQADMSVTRRWPGVGLGLARAQKIAQLAGGDVQICALMGNGACLRLRMPSDVD